MLISSRLLSFLTDIERALQADDPSPRGGSWENSRTVNYGQGLARLNVATRNSPDLLEPRGAVLLQSFQLADGTACLKVSLNWTGNEAATSHAIYAREGVDWRGEARRLAATWQNGPIKSAPAAVEDALEPVQATG